jgi:hypothetical protein
LDSLNSQAHVWRFRRPPAAALDACVWQVDLSQQYGYDKSSVSNIVHIYPRLKDAKFGAPNFSNRELEFLARVESDAFRYALEIMPDPSA